MTARHAAPRRLTAVDKGLVGLYLIGIYLGIGVGLPGGIPLPGVLAGAAGLALLAKHAARVSVGEIACFTAILTIAMLSIAAADDYRFLGERFKGVVQLGYSIAIAYGFYLAARNVSAAWLSRFSLTMCIVILVAGALENSVTAFTEFSNAFRTQFFDSGVYSADLRDLALYGHIRPKAFTSEPSLVTFGFLLFAFTRFALASARTKTIEYIVLLGLGFLILRGPTVLLGLVLIPVYYGLLAARRGGQGARHIDLPRMLLAFAMAGAVAAVGLFVGTILFENRLEIIATGRDASVFARIIAPPMVAWRILGENPFAGAGLAGWEYIERIVQQLYATTTWLETDFRFESAAHALTNWFWLHWIFLGLFFGILMIIVLTMLLRAMGVPSVAFCWAVWAVFGQAAGSYVGPRTWAVLVLAGVIALIHEREALARHRTSNVRVNALTLAPFAHVAAPARPR
jgi:hypothetical protein